MYKPKLFLVCPDCHMERVINNHFKGEIFFLTALGSIFHTSYYDYAASINNFLINQNIKEIIIVNDCTCRFIQSVLKNDEGFHTNAEEVLQVLHTNCQIELLTKKKLSERAFKLAELNIRQEAQSLLDSPYFGKKLANRNITLKGMIYERESNSFVEVSLG